MATITPTVTPNPNGHRQCVLVVWSGMATGDVGAPVSYPMHSDASVQIEGTFGGATVTMQVTNEATPTNWQTMADPQGTDIAKTAADLEQALEMALWIRPNVTGGAGSGLAVTMLMRRTP